MTKEKLLELLSGGSEKFSEVVKRIGIKPAKNKTKYNSLQSPCPLTPLEEFNVENHPVFDRMKRKDTRIKNKEGNLVDIRSANRIGLAFEEYICGRAAAFLCANPINYQAAPNGDAEEKMWAAFKRVNEQTKLDYKNQEILTMRMSETEVAEIWFIQDIDDDDDYWSGTDVKEKKKPRLFIAAPSLDDEIYPVFDPHDNLIAFGRKYIEINDEGKEVLHFDVYIDDKVYEGAQEGSTWAVDQTENPVKKIPVIYHNQKEVEWAKVRSIIRRLEDLYSNFGESNDKTAFPILALFGEVKNLPDTVASKAMQFSENAKAQYLVPPHAPDAVKLEIETLWRALHIITDTVDISPETLQGIGQTSGVALELLFMPAHLKASKHSGTFGEAVQRRINLIKKIIVTIDPTLKEGMSLTIKPHFDFFLPKDYESITSYLSTAVSASSPFISQETATAILQNSMGGDGTAELERIKKEKEVADKSQFNPDNPANQ